MCPIWITKTAAEASIASSWPWLEAMRISRASFVARLPVLALSGFAIGIISVARFALTPEGSASHSVAWENTAWLSVVVAAASRAAASRAVNWLRAPPEQALQRIG